MFSCSGLPERVSARPSGEADDSIAEETGASLVPEGPIAVRASTAPRSRSNRLAKSASATKSSIRVNPLLRHISGEAGEDAVGIARVGDRQVDAVDHRVGRF